MLKPLGDRIVLELIEEPDTTAGGIVLPQDAKNPTNRGKVIAVGPGPWASKDSFNPPVSPDQIVIFNHYAGQTVDGLKIVRESDVVAVAVE